jgi:hypothetical protein
MSDELAIQTIHTARLVGHPRTLKLKTIQHSCATVFVTPHTCYLPFFRLTYNFVHDYSSGRNILPETGSLSLLFLLHSIAGSRFSILP